MTDPDTAPKATEQPIRFRPVISADNLVGMRMDRDGGYVRYEDYAALSAALERKKEAAEFWEHCAAITEKRAEALDAKLNEAVKLLVSAETVMQFVLDHEASELDKRLTIKDAMSSQKEIRAFLASLEGDKP